MTFFARFMRSSLTSARRAICSSSYSQQNRLRCAFDKVAKRSEKRCPATASYSYGDYGFCNNPSRCKASMLLGASFAFLGFFENKEEEKEPALITTIKRSILLIQKGEFKKAEQMLHIALRQAQSLQNEDGITYVYDVMANLAFEVGEFEKAEKLFRSVMQRILAAGTPQDDLKIVHMSLKMAKILESKGDLLNAENGYQFCMKILQDHIDKGTEDIDIITLWSMNLDWYAHLLLNMARYSEAMNFMQKAYDLCVKLNGELHEQCVVLLNDLGSISFMKGNLDEAIEYLNKAAEIGKQLPDMEDIASIHVNLGNVYLKKGLLDEAKKCCAKGWKLSKDKNNYESLDEAKACLDEVNKLLTK
ncbi:tetratricopeptide repeat protein 19 homolog, mitochondrial [Nasonia vitripennis]|uniref:MalT-like TPR region domain-containing protein n=1 Tax=Nasonia vitripennis TaxID=7425 RepID=A0A7M7IQW7_NASVI|nr:tetratricopeptide repeat protein 19 homolog, mitochondrial [Nasonia vitripennis]XP_008212524.1 tetratricopeptide repeat protein 19 homolog, mitochondrial [Nasonia vitripennis]XP_008212525.1 tetratricopeptide repeat protein 19 homolog, mitochondrial [Nasonia vitripennis]XP_016838135.1 tetratricopeptide repeat protein 19 homolog, mitochondrial [Nasonia vitripennis]XP_031778642.1 tetratricopeptide repeat protein 19 homolog, mitochondrial [Nasonia vitripennis]